MAARYHCGQKERRDLVAASALSGIDFVEVFDNEAPDESRQKLLILRLLQPIPAADSLTADNLVVEGGARVTGIRVLWAARLVDVTAASPPAATAAERALLAGHLPGAADRDHYLVFRVDGEGDYSTYTLRLVSGPDDPAPPDGFDLRLTAVDLFFKVECPSDFDCRPANECPPETFDEPRIDYLAKDYRSFRRLLLDRMAASSRSGGSAARPISGSPWSRCWPTPATSSATSRTRSPPRPTSAPPGGGSRCAATPGWSTTGCTRAQTPGPGSRSTCARRSPCPDRPRRGGPTACASPPAWRATPIPRTRSPIPHPSTR